MTPLHPTEPIQVALCNGWKGAKPEAADFKHGLPLSAVSGNSWAEFKPAWMPRDGMVRRTVRHDVLACYQKEWTQSVVSRRPVA